MCWDIWQLYGKAKLKPQSELEQASATESAPLELASQILLFFSILQTSQISSFILLILSFLFSFASQSTQLTDSSTYCVNVQSQHILQLSEGYHLSQQPLVGHPTCSFHYEPLGSAFAQVYGIPSSAVAQDHERLPNMESSAKSHGHI